eukprot:4862200-Pleurochrysis_carterae.AAC.3
MSLVAIAVAGRGGEGMVGIGLELELVAEVKAEVAVMLVAEGSLAAAVPVLSAVARRWRRLR